MDPNYLDFEQPIVELINKIDSLSMIGESTDSLDIHQEVKILQEKATQLTSKIFDTLSPWQVSQLSRHPQRPYTLDYVENIFTDVQFLHGDRQFADDKAIVGGLAKLSGKRVVFIGQQKGRDGKEKVARNFGMPRPEGYRKACRLMKLAERFNLPLITFIDTPGAYPGIDAEERGQSEAIANNLLVMSQLQVPIISVIIGEGGSGGALAIGVADRLLMLQYATYSVISPEGCAAILWKDPKNASDAAAALGITSDKLLNLGLIDEIIAEPLGSAYRDKSSIYAGVLAHLETNLNAICTRDKTTLLEQRYQKILSFGRHVRN
jgi:acetyl-CoA carboxylase carboxyl transferase subunit alpha